MQSFRKHFENDETFLRLTALEPWLFLDPGTLQYSRAIPKFQRIWASQSKSSTIKGREQVKFYKCQGEDLNIVQLQLSVC